MIIKLKKILIAVSLLAAVFAVAHFALAATVDPGLNQAAGTGLSADSDPRVIAANIIRIALGFLGIVAVGLIIYAGWLYMTANGEAEKAEKAKKILIGAIIGLLICLASFAIASYILSRLTEATGGSDTGDGTVCSPSCGDGQHCCASVCVPSATSCGGGGPDAFAISATIPRDEATDVIRNVMVKVYFNRAIADTVSQTILDNNLKVEKIATVDPVGGAETALAEAQAVGGAVLLSDSRQEINFRSSAPCGDEKDTKYCFESWSKYKISLNGGSGIISINNQGLSCSAGSKCEFVFSTNNLIDTNGPTAGIVPTQICKTEVGVFMKSDANTVTGWGRDDVGISGLKFYQQKQPAGAEDFVNSPGAGNGQRYQSVEHTYITTGMTVGDTYKLRVEAVDMAGQLVSDDFSTTIRPGHCCNGVKDPGETDTDCGGDCGACDGAACANDISVPATCNDNLCASQVCRSAGSTAAKCTAAGYADEITSCCLCQRPPVITGISPAGGFCKNENEPDKACLKDGDCASGDSCDQNIPNGKAGNFFTIYGRNFGASTTPGTVYASSTTGWVKAELANNAAAGGNAQCKDAWSDNQITAIVPGGAETGEIKVENSGGLNTTSDKNGVLDFKINNIDRPGICELNPDSGKQDQIINYYGVKLSGFSPYFGNINNNVAGVRPSFNDNKTGTAAVPNITTGQTSSFVLKDKVYSNYLDFTKERELYKGPFITSFDPKEGAAGQYVTINGNGFGTTTGAVFFDDISSGKRRPASFEFPEKCKKSIWSDKQVIVKVPNGLTNGNYKITMKIGSWPAIDTSSIQPAVDFKFDKSLLLRPGLCLIDPLTGNINTQVSLYGEYFGTADDNSRVRFQANKDQKKPFEYWAKDDDKKITGIQADKITTNVPDKAVTGQVKVVQTKAVQGVIKELIGNGMIFNVGVCKIKDDCGSGSLCCSAGTPYSGQCKTASSGQTEQDVCFPEIKSCVYEWNFSTAGSPGAVGDPCDKNIATPQCNKDDAMCQTGLVCDPSGCVCKKPCNSNPLGSTECKADNNKCGAYTTTPNCNTTSCLCECRSDSDCENYGETCNTATGVCTTEPPKESCSGYGLSQCKDTYFCPNSPGQCSTSQAKSVDTGVKCTDDACKILTGCKDKDGNNLCTYSTALNKCKKTSSVCDLTKVKEVSDAAGNKFDLKCGLVDNKSVWYYDSNQTCAASGYTKSIDKTKCLGAACNICTAGFVCQQDGSSGVCAVNQAICPAGAACIGGKCIKSVQPSCDCCCDKTQNTDSGSNPGCCTGLKCGDSCGAGGNLGLCTGCTVTITGANGKKVVNQTASNLSCNCPGTNGKFCDTSGAGGLGTCKDCTQLSTGQLCSGLGEGSCCVDNAKGDACRGISAGGGSLPPDTAFQEIYSENFEKDGELAGWQPADCGFNYSVNNGHLNYNATVLNDCPFDIKYDYKFFAGDSYKITIKALTNLGSYKYVAKLNDGTDFLTAEAVIPPYNIPDQEYTLDFPTLAKDFSQLEFYQVNRDGKIIRVTNGADSVDYIKIAKKTDYAFCAYYSCGADGYADKCQAAQKTGTYRTADCGNNCVKKPSFGETCFKVSTSTTNQICDENICSDFSCLNEDGSGPNPKVPNSCGTCCCDPNAEDSAGKPVNQCASLNSSKTLKCVKDKGSCSGVNRGLCCGCSADSDCGSPDITGCGSDTCCDGRPVVVDGTAVPRPDNYPKPYGDNVCRNSLIKATFNRPMSLDTFSGNVIVAGDYGADQCPANTTYLTAAYQPNFLAKLKFWLAKLPLVNKLFADAARADAVGNFCAIKGTVNGVNNADKTATLEFAPAQVLEPSRKYYVIIKGDTDITDAVKQGVLSASGIGMNPDSADGKTFNGVTYKGKVWSFTTKDASAADGGICLLNSVSVNPDSYLFNTIVNDPADDTDTSKDEIIKDGDKIFYAKAYASDNQQIVPIPGIYNWSWDWTIDNQAVVKFKNGESNSAASRTLIAQNVKDDSTLLHAKATITEDTASQQSTVGAEKQGQAQVYVFICSNLWPTYKTNGGWEPWRENGLKCSDPGGSCSDAIMEGVACGTYPATCIKNCADKTGDCSNTNFELYYCRDAGGPGTADDLPVIQSDSAVIRGRNVDILKEFYFFREGKPNVSDINLATTTNDTIEQGGKAGLTWSAIQIPDGQILDKYQIYYGIASTSLTQSISATTPGTADSPVVVSNLTNGVKYYFAVTAKYKSGAESAYSNKTSFVPADTSPPQSINRSDFSATPGNRLIEVWMRNTDNTASYIVSYGASPNFGSSVTVKQSQCAADGCTASINSLANGVKYYLGVAAIDSAGNKSAISYVISVIPFAPAANLTLVGVGDGTVKLSWDSAVGAAKYKVYYNKNGDSVTASVTTSTAGTTANPQVISGLINGAIYNFVVRSVGVDSNNGDIESVNSNKISVKLFASAKNLSLVGVGDGTVKLSWSAAQFAASYKVYYNDGGNIFNDFVATSTIGTAANPQIISKLTNGTTYYFAVKSINADNMENADYSNKVSAVPKK